MAAEGWFSDQMLDQFSVSAGGDRDNTWTCMKDLAKAVAEHNIFVLMIGMPDGDADQYPELYAAGSSFYNSWPAKDYARSLSAAIDHLLKVAPEYGMSVASMWLGVVHPQLANHEVGVAFLSQTLSGGILEQGIQTFG